MDKRETSRQTLVTTYKRAQAIVNDADSFKGWPNNASSATVAFATALAQQALELVNAGLTAIGIDIAVMDEPLVGDRLTSIAQADTAHAAATDMAVSDVIDVASALARRFAATANELCARAEAALEGQETIDGQRIHRSPLHDK